MRYPDDDRAITSLIKKLRLRLLDGGENHDIDVDHKVLGSTDGFMGSDWEEVDRVWDLNDRASIERWLRRLRRILRNHKRLRLYGDDHKVEVAA